jgi:hypothetical protein
MNNYQRNDASGSPILIFPGGMLSLIGILHCLIQNLHTYLKRFRRQIQTPPLPHDAQSAFQPRSNYRRFPHRRMLKPFT